jgi:hypothetical protein
MAKIHDWHTPHNYHEVQQFLGLVQYLAHFLPDILGYTGPISAMEKNGRPFFWTLLHNKCFQMIKAICCRMPILCPMDHNQDEPVWVICNVSVYGVGAMYGQGPTWQTCRPAGFVSKKFTDTPACAATFINHLRALTQQSSCIQPVNCQPGQLPKKPKQHIYTRKM